jgi:hypothetical protein
MLRRILNNGFAIAAEIGLVALLAWAGYSWPIGFAVLTVVVSLAFGIHLELARVTFELPFYFFEVGWTRRFLARLAAAGEACLKAAVAGLAALLTFSGTDQQRLMAVAILFAIIVFAGASVLRRLSISFGAVPARWGYFRLAAPLGVLFSLALSFLPAVGLSTIGYEIFNLPERPSLERASELLFILKQKFDEIVMSILALFLNADLARIAGAFVSVNVLTGFVLALYAVAVSEIGRIIEDGGVRPGTVATPQPTPQPVERVPPDLG